MYQQEDKRTVDRCEAGSLKMNTALEYSTRVVQEGGRRCKKSTLNDLVHLTPLRIPLMNPPKDFAPYVLCMRYRDIKKRTKSGEKNYSWLGSF
jgi:hypothetical protein